MAKYPLRFALLGLVWPEPDLEGSEVFFKGAIGLSQFSTASAVNHTP